MAAMLSCTKTDPKPAPNPQSFSAIVGVAGSNPSSWQTSSISSSSSGGTLLITATKSDGTSMVIKMPYPIALGTNYTQNWQTYNILFNIGGATYQPSLGQVGVTSNTNGVLVGTFTGTMHDYTNSSNNTEIDITNGAFTVNVQ